MQLSKKAKYSFLILLLFSLSINLLGQGKLKSNYGVDFNAGSIFNNNFYAGYMISPYYKLKGEKFMLTVLPSFYKYKYTDTNNFLKSEFNYAGNKNHKKGILPGTLLLKYKASKSNFKAGFFSNKIGVTEVFSSLNSFYLLDARKSLFGVQDLQYTRPGIEIEHFFSNNFSITGCLFYNYTNAILPTYEWLPKFERDLYNDFSGDNWLRKAIRDSFPNITGNMEELILETIGSDITIDYKEEKSLGKTDFLIKTSFIGNIIHAYYINALEKTPYSFIRNRKYNDWYIPDSLIYKDYRFQLVGFDFQVPIKLFGLKGEFTYKNKTSRYVSYQTDTNYITFHPLYTGVLGVDKFFADNSYLNLQFYTQYIGNFTHDSYSKKLQWDVQAALVYRKPFLKDFLKIQLTNIIDFSYGGSLSDIKLELSRIKNMTISSGARIFYKLINEHSNYSDYGPYNSYNKQSHIYLTIKYTMAVSFNAKME